MLAFLSILVGVVAMIFIARTTSTPQKLYRFTSTKYNDNQSIVMEISGANYQQTKKKANKFLSLYAGKMHKNIQWELVEEISEDTREAIEIVYTSKKETVNEQ
jgi:hypothetical protein